MPGRLVAAIALAALPAALCGAPVWAQASGGQAAREALDFESAFDRALGTAPRAPRDLSAPPAPARALPQAQFSSSAERLPVAHFAEDSLGRIGVAALDLSTGRTISILGDQRFPMASTSKIAVAAAFLEGVDQGRWSLTSKFALLYPVRSERYSSAAAPVRKGEPLAALDLIDLMITRSSNPATDALLAAMGGPQAVNDWAKRAGIAEFELTRDIATLVRDDGEFDPAVHIDRRDSATPLAMVQMLAGLYQGKWLSAQSRAIILEAMERCRTGRNRIPAMLPENVKVAHKTGTLRRTASDIGFVELPDGRTIALAIYVTGQSLSVEEEERNKGEARRKRDARIAAIARAVVDSYSHEGPVLALADPGAGPPLLAAN